MKLALATLFLVLTMSSLAGTASGTLTVNGKSFEMKHAYALQIEDWTDKSKNATLLIVCDKPLPAKLLTEELDTFALRDAGVNGIKFEFVSGGTNYAMMLVGAEINGSVSVSGTFDTDQFTAFSDSHVAGKTMNEKELGDTTFRYEISFDADVAPRVAKVAPTAEDEAAARNAESAKAYFAFYQALKSGDLKALRTMVDPEHAKEMDRPEFKENLAFIQSMMPTDVKVLKATEEGDNAELMLSGKDSGEDRAGTVLMVKKNGKWLVEKESWKSK
jgi:hypothetical protein